MVSSPLDLTPTNSVDAPGISVATAMASATDNRAGNIYDSALAACVPIYTTPISDREHLLVFSRRWTNASPSPVITGQYISYTIDNTPGWMIVDGSTGQRKPVDESYTIPISTPYSSAVLTAATSRPPHSTYLLYTITQGSAVAAVLQHVFFNQSMKTFSILSEEIIPDGHLGGPPVALVYHLTGIDNLILNPAVTAKIFTGQITVWNDPAIAALNTGITLPATTITPVYRSDTNTITDNFQSYLKDNGHTVVVGTGTAASSAYAAMEAVGETEGAVTYAEKPYAAQSDYPSARFGTITVRFDRGLFLHDQDLIVLGASAAGKVCMARKMWGRVGIASTGWEYYNGKGWDADPTEVQQARTTTGLLNSVGPISAFTFERNRVRLAAVVATGNQRYAQVYSLNNIMQWNPTGTPLHLGSAADGTYQGGTLQFHPQLRVVEELIDTPDSSGAVPYSITKKVFGAGTSGLQVAWGAWQISRLY